MVQPSACRRVASGSSGSGAGAGVGGARASPHGRDKSSQKKSKGRWMLHEHQQFMVGLEEFGRDWKAIGDIVRTRTAVQIRTHAQKYFQQREKGRCFPEEPYKSVDGERTAGPSSSPPTAGANSTPSSAPEHGGASTANRPDKKPLSSSSSSLSASSSSSSLSSASPTLSAPPTASLLAPHLQARVVHTGGGDGAPPPPPPPTRRAILTTPAGERGKRLTRPSGPGPCTVTATPRATRASSAAAAAAIVAATSAATADAAAASSSGTTTDGNSTDGGANAAKSDGSPFGGGDDEGGRGVGGGGDEFRGGDGKRRKLDRPPSADIIISAGEGGGGGMREAMEAVAGGGGSIFAVSHPGWLDQRFRGKRGLVSGNSGGSLDLAGMGGGEGGYTRVGLQVDVDLAGMYSDPPIILSPTFRKAGGGSPPWSMIGNMEEGEAVAAAVVSGAGVQGLVGWRSDVVSPSRHKSPLFSDTFLEDFLVGGGVKDSPDSSDEGPPPPLCASSSSISCSSSISSNSSSSLSSSTSSSSSSSPSEGSANSSSSCQAAGSHEFGLKPYTAGSFSATASAGASAASAAAGAAAATATAAVTVTPGNNICTSSAIPSTTDDHQHPTSRGPTADGPPSCEGFGYGFAVGPDDCVVPRHATDSSFSLDSMPIPLSGGAHQHEMGGNGILGGSDGSPFPSQKPSSLWGVSTAGGGDVRGGGGGYSGGDFDDNISVFSAIHGGVSGPSSGTGMGTGTGTGNTGTGTTGMDSSRQIDFLPFQHQQQQQQHSAPSPARSNLGRSKGAMVAAAAALTLSEQQAAAVAAAVHDCFTTSVGGAARENAALQSSLGARGDIEDGPLCGNWLSYEDVGDGIGAGQDGLGMEADDAEALDTLFAFEDHFGML